MTTWRVKRIYEEPADADGYRVLVDRLWSRGISKEAAHLNKWCKDTVFILAGFITFPEVSPLNPGSVYVTSLSTKVDNSTATAVDS